MAQSANLVSAVSLDHSLSPPMSNGNAVHWGSDHWSSAVGVSPVTDDLSGPALPAAALLATIDYSFATLPNDAGGTYTITPVNVSPAGVLTDLSTPVAVTLSATGTVNANGIALAGVVAVPAGGGVLIIRVDKLVGAAGTRLRISNNLSV